MEKEKRENHYNYILCACRYTKGARLVKQINNKLMFMLCLLVKFNVKYHAHYIYLHTTVNIYI